VLYSLLTNVCYKSGYASVTLLALVPQKEARTDVCISSKVYCNWTLPGHSPCIQRFASTNHGCDVGLDPGTSTGATVTTRKMTGPGGAVLAYSLSRDSAHTLNWGNTVGTDTESGSGNGSAQALTVYGQVAANQFVAPGNYTDTISATVTF
jgi:hypothetical protein